jgi:hypothetical protein
VSATATVTIRSRPRVDVEAGLAGLPFCFARANPRANHSRGRTHKWLTNNAVCVCHGEEVSADFERREGGTEGNRGCSCQVIGPRSHTQNVREPRVSCGKHK